ncbi:hypothetical protein [Anaeromyxobacter sp. Fw109-5]|uniref:hypothetical protein n=1 Tax=Anaeromyxobacter sp. (strain Fw109-5) TaxID=404589 RepID=UPI0000ED6E32|nr:hypothetical protein [Anaeromyxobacter sp. Fw109-5]ABS28160.1 hypothetical protein Anae109_3982 [Anaeromyxobacter sp. Fw109-5]
MNETRGKTPADPDVIFNKSAKHLRRAAKACRVNKGGLGCAVLDVAAALIDNAPALSQALGDGAIDATVSAVASKAADVAKLHAAKTASTRADATPAPERKPTHAGVAVAPRDGTARPVHGVDAGVEASGDRD